MKNLYQPVRELLETPLTVIPWRFLYHEEPLRVLYVPDLLLMRLMIYMRKDRAFISRFLIPPNFWLIVEFENYFNHRQNVLTDHLVL